MQKENQSVSAMYIWFVSVSRTSNRNGRLSPFLQRYDWLVGNYNHTATKISAKQIMNTNNDIRVKKKKNINTSEKIHAFVLNYSKKKFFRFKGEENRIHVCRSFGLRAGSMSAIGVHFGYTSACVAIFKVSIASWNLACRLWCEHLHVLKDGGAR